MNKLLHLWTRIRRSAVISLAFGMWVAYEHEPTFAVVAHVHVDMFLLRRIFYSVTLAWWMAYEDIPSPPTLTWDFAATPTPSEQSDGNDA